MRFIMSTVLCSALQALEIGGQPQLVAPLVKQLGTQEIEKKEILCITQLIYKAAKFAIQDLQKGKLESFDALVSDCACQIRAIFVATLAQKVQANGPMLQEYALRFDAKLRALQADSAKMAAKGDKAACLPYIEKAKLDIAVPEEIAVITHAYLLTKTKNLYTDKIKRTVCNDCREPIQHLTEKTNVSKLGSLQKGVNDSNFAGIVEAAKVALSQSGARYLQQANVVEALSYPHNRRVIHGRIELPCIFTIQAMMKLALQNNIAILLKVRRAAHLLERADDPYDVEILYKPLIGGLPRTFPHNVGTLVQEYAEAPVQGKVPVIVVEGQRCDKTIKDEPVEAYRKRLLHERIGDLIEMNGAAHKQYSNGGRLDELEYRCDEERVHFCNQAARALLVGASQENQRLLSITHIFASIY